MLCGLQNSFFFFLSCAFSFICNGFALVVVNVSAAKLYGNNLGKKLHMIVIFNWVVAITLVSFIEITVLKWLGLSVT